MGSTEYALGVDGERFSDADCRRDLWSCRRNRINISLSCIISNRLRIISYPVEIEMVYLVPGLFQHCPHFQYPKGRKNAFVEKERARRRNQTNFHSIPFRSQFSQAGQIVSHVGSGWAAVLTLWSPASTSHTLSLKSTAS